MLNDFSLKDTDFIKRAIARSNVVINLVGQRTETMNFTFDDVHAEWPKRLAKVVAEAGHVERFVHFSDIAASPDHASRRMRSKAAGDKAVRELVPSATIMKPAPIVGIEDYFFNAIIHQVCVKEEGAHMRACMHACVCMHTRTCLHASLVRPHVCMCEPEFPHFQPLGLRTLMLRPRHGLLTCGSHACGRTSGGDAGVDVYPIAVPAHLRSKPQPSWTA
eukprot:362507-Chlamydomonas_euryale.AAC.6